MILYTIGTIPPSPPQCPYFTILTILKKFFVVGYLKLLINFIPLTYKYFPETQHILKQGSNSLD